LRISQAAVAQQPTIGQQEAACEIRKLALVWHLASSQLPYDKMLLVDRDCLGVSR
jgi:hypothetical protein